MGNQLFATGELARLQIAILNQAGESTELKPPLPNRFNGFPDDRT
jgi:hypothetical protein